MKSAYCSRFFNVMSNEDEKMEEICQGQKRGGENAFVKGQLLKLSSNLDSDLWTFLFIS
jgi:hypothetical protein